MMNGRLLADMKGERTYASQVMELSHPTGLSVRADRPAPNEGWKLMLTCKISSR